MEKVTKSIIAMKKLLFLLTLMLSPVLVNASDSFEINGIYYELFANNKTATVVPSPDHYSGDIVIPENVT